ncbi:MAG TPA: hypothetical protein VLX31_19220 [Streptosporangiaceae bacterium]|nr:hypothetical protein [Streptosporangiaceae bacterium]
MSTAAWIAGFVALFAFLLRISLSSPINSDGANNALQAWSILHGDLLLHGWIIGDATFYTFELPLYAVIESIVGLHSLTIHAGSAITFVIVAACAAAIAMTGSRGAARAARGGVVVAVLAAALLTPRGVAILLEKPDHTGTSAIMLVSFLLIDRLPNRRFTPPVLCAILTAGQLGDATVLYVGVPAVMLVCCYRIAAERGMRAAAAAQLVAAAASVPLAMLIRSVVEHHGGYLMVAPRTGIAPISTWPQHAWLTLRAIGVLYGAAAPQGSALGVAGAVIAACWLLAAAVGFVKVIWRWRTASRAEQMLCAAIVCNIGAYLVSTLPNPTNEREIVAVLPFGAILAARACVPGRIADVSRRRLATAAVGVAVLLPLAAEAVLPPATLAAAPLASWLEAHGLRYGVAGYWDASAITVQSGDQVRVRAVSVTSFMGPTRLGAQDWETDASWYNPSLHYANFVVADLSHTYADDNVPWGLFEKYFGRPVSMHRVAGRVILIYRRNLLRQVRPALPLPKHDR